MSATNPFRDPEELYLNGIREDLAALRQRRVHYVAVMASLSGEELTSAKYDGRSLDIHFASDRAKFTRVFGAIRRLGFVPTSRPEPGATSHSTFMDHPSGAQIWLAFTSTSCRRVQVGTTMVEQPVYETICDDVPAEDAA